MTVARSLSHGRWAPAAQRVAMAAMLALLPTLARAQAVGPAAAGLVDTTTALPFSCSRTPLRIAVDIGHAPKHHGATSARGRPEYGFNARFASELVKRAQSTREIALFLLDPDALRTSLADRPAHAAQLGAEVLVSIHHDYVNDKYVKSWQFGGRRHAYADDFEGYSLFTAKANGAAATSIQLALALGARLKAAGLAPTLHHAEKIPGEGRLLLDKSLGVYDAPFAVLRLAAMPAVLFEVGVLANRDEELRLEDGAYRGRIQDAFIAGLVDYCGHGATAWRAARASKNPALQRAGPSSLAPPAERPLPPIPPTARP